MDYTVLEFYSGIGGMHYALAASGVKYSVVRAFEIHDGANAVYRHNFPSTSLHQRNICGLTVEELDKLDADLWTMSPPCQPFSRLGKRKDIADARTDSFQTLLQHLKRMKKPPRWILVENVKGFEESEARSLLLHTVKDLNMFCRECLLSPTHFKIPNSRLRYYFLARKTRDFDWGMPNEIFLKVPDEIDSETDLKGVDLVPASLKDFIQTNRNDNFIYLPDKILLKYASILDIVTESSTNSCCFTKAYGHYAEGTGSVIQMNTECSLSQQFALAMREDCSQAEKLNHLRKLGLRYFQPLEIARLMKFPENFEFPSSISMKQQYKLLGNSVNVLVVAELLNVLFRGNTC